MVHPYQNLLDCVAGLGKDHAPANRQLSELISLHECISMISKAKNAEELIDVFSLTVLGEHPCRSAVVYIQEDGVWQRAFYRGASKINEDFSEFGGFNSIAFERKIYEASGNSPELTKVLEETGLTSMGIQKLVALQSQGRLVGLLGLGQPMIPINLENKSQWLLTLCDLFGALLGSSLDEISLEKVNRILEKRLFQLQTIREATDVFIRCYNNKSVFRALSQNLMGQLFISRSGVMDRKSLNVEFTMGCKPDDLKACLESRIHKDFLTGLKPHRLVPVSNSPRFAYAMLLTLDQGEGYFLLLGPRLNGQEIEQDDENLVVALARQASAALDNITLQEQRVENERMLKELELARTIQQKLLPKKEPEIEGYEVTAEMRPFKQVGGDFFDWFRLGDSQGETRWGFCLADVSGKSLPASMIMTTTQASLRALASFSSVSPQEIIDRLNKQLCTAIPSNRFVTMFFGILDPVRHRLTYINAGHNPPILIHPEAGIRPLREGGMVLGMFPSAPYKVGEVDFLPGSELLIYTDGLSELVNSAGEEMGDDWVATWLTERIGQTPLSKEKDDLFQMAMDYAGNQMIDDMTVVFLRRNY